MRLPDDDEIYDVDQTYLGPEGHYIGRFRYRALLIYPLMVLLGMGVLVYSGIGVGINGLPLLATGALFMGAKKLTDWILERTTAERPLSVLLTAFRHEVSARRVDRKAHASRPTKAFAHRATRVAPAVKGDPGSAEKE